MSGTEWTKKGQGATTATLRKEVKNRPYSKHLMTSLARLAFLECATTPARSRRTNLRLTGERLAPEDLENITKVV